MCQEAAVSVARAIAARRRARRALILEGLPGEGSAIKETFLLPAGCQRTAVGTAVRGVLPADVAQTVTAGNWTPGHRHKAPWDGEMEAGKRLAQDQHINPHLVFQFYNYNYKRLLPSVPSLSSFKLLSHLRLTEFHLLTFHLSDQSYH